MINMYYDEIEKLFDPEYDYSFAVTVDGVRYVIMDTEQMEIMLDIMYGDRVIFYAGDKTLEERKNRFKKLYEMYKRSKEKDYEYIVKAYFSDYNPIANVDANETVTTEHGKQEVTDTIGEEIKVVNRGDDKVTAVYGGYDTTEGPHTDTTTNLQGKQEVSNTVGEYMDTMNYGQKKNIDSLGTVTTETSRGAHTDTINHSKTAMNNPNTLLNTEKDSNDYGKQTDTETVSSKTDTHTNEAYADTTTHGSHTDKSSISDKTDKITSEIGEKTVTMSDKTDNTTSIYGDLTSTTNERTNKHAEAQYTDTVRTVRIGNIGVTMTQQMINAELNLRTGKTLSEIFMDGFIDRYTVYC